jgi:lipid-A-disaccharide synthase
VLIDYPDFNLRVARKAKKLGIPILYYVSPQVWAWRPARVKLIARLVEKIAVILPFEREIYRQAGVPCDFVGHPVIDEIREIMTRSGSGIDEIGAQSLKVAIRKEIGLDPARPVMTLMPGSRPHEIKALLPVMSEVIKSMRQQYPAYQFVIPLAPNLDEHKLAIFSVLNKKGDMSAHCRVIKGESVKALLCSDCAVIASGTSTFQASLLKVPFVVVYKVSPLTFFLGKRIVKVDHICLVNLLLNKSAEGNSGLYVKELMQEDVTGRNIMEEITKILEEPLYRSEMLLQFDRVRRLFIDKQASERVAEMIEAVAAAHSHSPVTL